MMTFCLSVYWRFWGFLCFTGPDGPIGPRHRH